MYTRQYKPTCVSDLFFSEDNMAALQEGIRYGVFQRSNGKLVVGAQSAEEMHIVMNSVFLQNSKNLPEDIVGQVRRLNKLVLDYCIANVYSNAMQHKQHVRDLNHMYRPLPRAESMSSAGLKTIHMKSM